MNADAVQLAEHWHRAGMPEHEAVALAATRAAGGVLPSLQHPHVQRVLADHLRAVLDLARTDVEQEAGATLDVLAERLARDPGQHAPPPPRELVAGARAALGRTYDAGVRSVHAELARTRGTVRQALADAGPPPEAAARLTALAEVVAARVTSSVWAAIKRAQALGAPAEQLPAMGREAGAQAARSEAMQSASQALNLGRKEAEHEPDVQGVIYTAVMDDGTCDACAAADTGDVLPLDSPDRVEPPNPDCEGGGRCRCIEVFVLGPA